MEGVLYLALTHGGLLGAIQLPIAALTLLPAANLRSALVSLATAAVIGGVVPAVFGRADLSPVLASVMFWGSCAAGYRARKLDRYIESHANDREYWLRDTIEL